ncbi:MAG: NAD(P) transhydrogenase subunit alpha [Gemmatimonadetes bacterium 13_2_20CM_69_27]|nr:MAG: NAD(P) transhydrogenase subunit alpha [Gemmatimonadetes bacterium 13_2_20CM_69_27]OLB54013.1 MAG: NAD(P) transhydrogenase subunit alpha [Gemmatimonadetes bacterium 13_2_20CM_2_69_23]PYO30572.1 MAG: Re/Si-specific NAD(P)(+) transhydrogenase subunit alpha [Gemmatimonadota bacterium]
MKIGVPKETAADERRVALTPDVAGRLGKSGLAVLVERGAGEAASFGDEAYQAAGATVVPAAAALFRQSDVVLKVQPPSRGEVRLCREGAALVAVFQPSAARDAVAALAARKVTAFSLALLPRITRAQAMDVLSSQATVAGYKAVLLAAAAAGRLFPMLVTAAGTLAPARVLVLGAGVAGLQAIATARRLGAVVSAFDVRPAVQEQVESLGAKFLRLEITEQAEGSGGYAKELSEETHRRELAFIAQHLKDTDVVITTAAIPGKRAPLLITAGAVGGMKPGSVIVDLAAETGGNCELTKLGRDVVRNGVLILGPANLPSTVPYHASQMYARNVSSFLLHVTRDGTLVLDFDDEITRDTCVTHAGEVRKP